MKQLKLIGVFILCLLVLDRLIGTALGGLMATSPSRFAQLYHGDIMADILVLGDSRANRHFSPVFAAREGYRMTNLGLGGNHLPLSAVLYADYLDRHPAPNYVVLEVSSARVGTKDLGELLPFTMVSKRMRGLLYRQDPVYYHLSQALTGLRYNSVMTLRVLARHLTPARESYLAGKLAAVDPASRLTLSAVTEDRLEAVREIVRLSVRHEVTPIFVFAPHGL